ncbi:type 1 glutamine amidotransferase [Halostella salina]|uniref:type 1 glutamine amidotransferase n=1 Tax=Halostella salina TaxID=1547897 RepID=UPI0013CF1B0A|nr:type 1 glutamine amidotransferase [Halostella salina]
MANFRRLIDPIDGVEPVEYDVRGLELPDDDEVGAAVITGSVDSVNDDRPYVRALREWVRNSDVPIFGVCFGHQIIADALGGTVARMRDPELGYRTLTVDRPDDPLFDGLPAELTAFACHGDAVVDPPPDATVLASNDRGVQALRAGRNVSIQFHPEVDPEFARTLLGDVTASEDDRVEALATVTAANYRESLRTRVLFRNFLEATGTDGR